MITFPQSLFFIPYYYLAIASFFGHIASIHFLKMNKNILGLSVKIQSNIILLFGILLSLIIIYGLINSCNDTDVPIEYNIMVGK